MAYMSTKAKTIIAAALVLAMCVFIFVMSAKPATESDRLSLGVVDQIISLAVPGYNDMGTTEQAAYQSYLNHIVRKCAHATEFALLGILVFNLLIQLTRAHRKLDSRDLSLRLFPLAAGAWVISTLYAVTDELHQIFVAGRSCQLTDVCIDSSGVLAGILISCAILALIRRRRQA